MQKAGIPFDQKQIDEAGLEVAQRTIDAVSAAVCVWCGEAIHFVLKEGWVHRDGQAYKKRPDGSLDHQALPKHNETLP
jgi:hypothetical protein